MSAKALETNRLQPLATPASCGRLATFYLAYPDAVPPMRADKAALGGLPVKAYQYCEAIRTASSFGWYAFPVVDLQLLFDGVDTFWADDSEWHKLTVEHLPDSEQWWDPHCPPNLAGKAPPFVSSLGVPGFVQIWSGLLIKTRRDWSSLVRPIANLPGSNQFFCFEGIVETDNYSPMPLFINIKLQKTDTVISFAHDEPLFQIQPVQRASYSNESMTCFDTVQIADSLDDPLGMTDIDWQGYARTVRAIDPATDTHRSGDYARESRKRAKAEG